MASCGVATDGFSMARCSVSLRFNTSSIFSRRDAQILQNRNRSITFLINDQLLYRLYNNKLDNYSKSAPRAWKPGRKVLYTDGRTELLVTTHYIPGLAYCTAESTILERLHCIAKYAEYSCKRNAGRKCDACIMYMYLTMDVCALLQLVQSRRLCGRTERWERGRR